MLEYLGIANYLHMKNKKNALNSACTCTTHYNITSLIEWKILCGNMSMHVE